MDILDETDRKILRLLQENASLTTKELAAAVHLTHSPVFERQKRLERDGFIVRYMAALDPNMVGNGFIVLCNVRLKQHNKMYGEQFVKAIGSMDEVVECLNTSGEYDFMMKILVRDMKHYQDFVLNRLGEIDCIGSLQSIFVIGEVKKFKGVPVYGSI